MLAEEGVGLVPAIDRLLDAVAGPLGGEEAVAGAVIAMELVSLAELLQYRLGAVDMVGRGVLVVIAEQAQQRTAQLVGEVDRRHRPLGAELLGILRIVDDDIAAPAIDRGVDIGQRAGGEIGVAAARAEADHADLAGGIGLLAQVSGAGIDIAYHLGVAVAAIAAR